jgi:hypothetical protein
MTGSLTNWRWSAYTRAGNLGRRLPSLAVRVSASNFRVPLGWSGTSPGHYRRPTGSFTPIGRPVDLVALRQEIIRTLGDYLLHLYDE